MIVIYKETLGNGTIVDMNTIELIETSRYGKIMDEVDRLRNEYGMERELIKGKHSEDVCLVYDKWKWYVMKC